MVDQIEGLKSESNWDLNARNLTDDDVRIVAMELQSNEHCCVLHLHLNHITDHGMNHLAEMLKKNRTLTDLYLGANDIGNQGVQTLCKALAQGNQTLTVVDLTCNQITDESLGTIVDLLKVNETLRGVMLTENPISEEGKSKLRQEATLRGVSFGANF